MSVLLTGAALLVSLPASAALTDSEKAQIKGFVQEKQLPTAARVRALVARPDLSLEESTGALADALVPVAFQDGGARYLHELVFGGQSLSGRPVLVSAVTRALLARADALLAKHAGDADQRPDLADELLRIYAFLDGQFANAGHPQPGVAHDAQTGIPASTYDDCVRALADHVQRNPRWLAPQTTVAPAFQRVRAQEELTLYEMTNDSPTRRVDAATALGLTGARRKLLTELGVLVLDSGAADDARVQRVRALYSRLGGIVPPPSGVEAIDFGDPHAPLTARAAIVSVPVPLEAAASVPVASEEVDGAPLDLPLFVMAFEVSKLAAARVLAERPELRRFADQDVQASQSARGAMTTDERVAGMMAQLLVDAPRTVELAVARFLAGRARTAGLLSDALGVLAALAPPGSPSTGLTVGLGHTTLTDGSTERIDASALRLAPTGAATSFVLAPHRWDIQRDAGGGVDGVRCDGQQATMAALHFARVPVTEATSWTAGGLVFARLAGTPRAGLVAGQGSRVRLVGVGELDAIATPAPGDDVVIEADLSVTGGEGGLGARAISAGTTHPAYQGVTLLLLPGSPARAVLRLSTGEKADTNLVQPVEVPSTANVHVKLTLKGSSLEATVGSVTLKGTLPALLAHGDVAVRASKGATVEASGLSIRRR